MARKKATNGTAAPAQAYRHDATRKNIPPAGLAAQGRVREAPKHRFSYDPHLPPVLRFDQHGTPDKLQELLQAATTRKLTEEEARLLHAFRTFVLPSSLPASVSL